MELFDEEDLTQTNLGQQLWSIYFDKEKFHCIGVVELSYEFITRKQKVDFERKQPLGFISMKKLTDDEEANLNLLTDLFIVSVCPNIFLFLEAFHENKPQAVQDFHLNVYENMQKFISRGLQGPKFPSLDRVNKPFQWTFNEKGYVINQYGKKIIKFEEPKLAQWVSIVGSQFSDVFQFVFQKTLSKIGAGPMLSINSSGGFTMTTMSSEAEQRTRKPYLQLKQLNKEIQSWNVHDNLKAMKIYLEDE